MLHFAEFSFDPDRRELRTANESVQLRPKTALLLQLFLENPGKVLSKDVIIDSVWDEATVTESSLYECMNDVRNVLNDPSNEPRFIKTVPRKGYYWIWREPDREQPMLVEVGGDATKHAKRKRLVGIWAASGVVITLALFIWMFHGRQVQPKRTVNTSPDLSICGKAEEAYRGNRMATAVELFAQCDDLATHQQLHLAWSYLGLSNSQAARKLGEQVLGAAQQRKDLDLVGKASRLLSRVASNREDYSTARMHYLGYLETLKTLGRDHEIAFALFDLAKLSINFGDVDQGESIALSALGRARDLGLRSLEPRIHLLLADVAWQRRQLTDWYRSMDRCMTLLQDNDPRAARNLIWSDMNRLLPLAIMKDRDDRAEQLFSRLNALLKQLPDTNTQHYFLAQIASRNADHETAYHWLKQSLIAHDPIESASQALYMSMSSLAARKLETAQQHRQFLQDQFASIQESEQANVPFMRWAYIAGEFGYWEEAESTLRQLLNSKELDVGFRIDATLRLGWVQLMQGRYTKVGRICDTLLSQKNGSLSEHQQFYAQFLKANWLFLRQRYDQAQSLCESLVLRNTSRSRRVHPRDAQLLILRFRLRLVRQQWDQAKLLIDNIAALRPNAYNDARSLNLYWAEYYLARDEDNLALPFLRSTAETDPWYQGMFPMLAEPNLLLANLYHRRQQWKQGRPFLDGALLRGPNNFEVLLLAAHYYQAAGHSRQALSFFQQAKAAGHEAWNQNHQASYRKMVDQ